MQKSFKTRTIYKASEILSYDNIIKEYFIEVLHFQCKNSYKTIFSYHLKFQYFLTFCSIVIDYQNSLEDSLFFPVSWPQIIIDRWNNVVKQHIIITNSIMVLKNIAKNRLIIPILQLNIWVIITFFCHNLIKFVSICQKIKP